MQLLTNLLLLAGAGLLLWFTYQTIKRQPQAFSATNINKSIFLLGILALLLIVLVAGMVWLLKQ